MNSAIFWFFNAINLPYWLTFTETSKCDKLLTKNESELFLTGINYLQCEFH
jgi:hypothetical protein